MYFVAALPDEELQNEVQQIKREIAEKYGSKAALKSPPHITLYMPFWWKQEKEEELFTALQNAALQHSTIKVHFENFEAFKPRVIFINVKESDELAALRKDVINNFKKELNIYDKGFEERPFHPHMTVAFRDLKKPMFFKAWDEEFKERLFTGSSDITDLTLLKHNGKSWDVYKNFPLKS